MSASERADDEGPGVPGLEMTPEAMRRLGYRVVDRLVDRWSGLRDAPAWIGGSRDETEPLLREDPPEEGRSAEEVLDRAMEEVLHRAGRVDHPRFFAFVPTSPTWPSVLADFLAAGFSVFQGTWLESAGPSQVELVVLDWFREWLEMPEETGGLLTSGGSAANLVGIVTAREHAGSPERAVVYMSDQAHSSLERAARIAGVPDRRIRKVATADDFRLDPGAVARAVERDRAEGRTPICVCSSAGATNTGVVDDLEALGAVCRRLGVWHHVDGAYGGFAVLTERGRAALAGIGAADSVTLDPHKWLFQPYEAGCVMVRDARILEDAFRVLPEYLQDTELGRAQVNFANRGLQLTRSFRALKVWMSIQTFGMEAFRAAVAGAMELARQAEAWIRERDGLELLSPASLGVVCFRCRPREGRWDEDALERLNAAVQDRIVESGFAMMSSTRLGQIYSLRLCILNYRSSADDVRRTLERVAEAGRRLASGAGT